MSAESPAGWAVLLAAYGGPDRLEDVEPYLLDVRGGRPTPPAVVGELRERYAAIGGRSPLLERTREQAAALEAALAGPRVYVGMRHWHPYLADTLEAMRRDGVTRCVAIALAPHYSRLSIGAYRAKIEQARGVIEVAMVESWHDQPRFLDAVAERVGETLLRFPEPARDRVALLFTAHSLPQRILAEGDPYPDQLRRSVDGVLARLGGTDARIAYQSAGRTPEPWLGPEAGAVIEELAADGASGVLLCPIGFVSDHLEVLYDVDIEYQALARRLGIRLERTASLGAGPLLVQALADLARSTARDRGWQT